MGIDLEVQAAGDATTTATIEPWASPFSQSHAGEPLPLLEGSPRRRIDAPRDGLGRKMKNA